MTVSNTVMVIKKDDASIKDVGEKRYIFPVNPLVQTVQDAEDIADILLAYYKEPRRDLDMDWRGNPALLLGDRITVTDNNEQNDYFVVRQELEFDGALRASLNGRKA